MRFPDRQQPEPVNVCIRGFAFFFSSDTKLALEIPFRPEPSEIKLNFLVALIQKMLPADKKAAA
jgi:hypothetical protein